MTKISCRNGTCATRWALCGDDVSEGVGTATLQALGLLNNTTEEVALSQWWRAKLSFGGTAL